VVFALPSQPVRLGLVVMAGQDASHSGTLFYVDYVPPAGAAGAAPHSVTVGTEQLGPKGLSKPPPPPARDKLRLSPRDRSISLRVYVDNTFSEAYWQGGRVAMTWLTPATREAAAAVLATQPAGLVSARAWRVGSMWVSPEEVLSAPRHLGPLVTEHARST